MIGPEQLEYYRAMSPAERWLLTAQLMEYAWKALLLLPTEERERRLAIARRHHDETNEAIAAGLR